ncbi:hypothetical protein V8E36_006746 [Tilletia maclaganii]
MVQKTVKKGQSYDMSADLSRSNKFQNPMNNNSTFGWHKFTECDSDDLFDEFFEHIRRVCTLWLLEEHKTLVVLSLDPGFIKYDPTLAAHQCQMLYLFALMQKGAEILIAGGTNNEVTRSALLPFSPLIEKVARVKTELGADSSVVCSMRNQSCPTKEQLKERVQKLRKGYDQHIKATDDACWKERLQAWSKYATSGPTDAWTITRSLCAVPRPLSMTLRSEEHRA